MNETTTPLSAESAPTCRHGFTPEVGCWRQECWPVVGYPVEAGSTDEPKPEYAYSGPCTHCGHLPDEHGVGYECLRWDARGWTYTPGTSSSPGGDS